MESTAIELQKKEFGLSLLAEAKSIEICDQAGLERASAFSSNTRTATKTIDEWMNPQIEAANKTHKLLTGKRNELKRPYLEAQAIADGKIGAYFMEQKRITAEAEARLRQEAEKQRLQAQEAIISQAIDQNDEKLLDAAENVFIPEIELPKTERTVVTESGSTNVRMDLKVEVVDKAEVVKSVARADINLGFVEVDLAYAKKYAKLMNWKPGTIEKPNIMFGLAISAVPIVSGRSK
jgi:hypothetical protein